MHENCQCRSALPALAENFLVGAQAGQGTLVGSPGNDERKQLNQTIRNLLLASGNVDSRGDGHSIFCSQGMTKAAMVYVRNYAEGDLVHFAKANKRLGVDRDTI